MFQDEMEDGETMAQLFKNIGTLLTLEKAGQKKQGRKILRDDLSIVNNAALLEREGRVVWVGPERELTKEHVRSITGGGELREVDFNGATCLPAFVECHTHLVHAGHRRNEFELRNQGVSYLEIAKQGGGIVSTVNATRRATASALEEASQQKLNRFIAQGVTTCEIKSGYGLNFSDEIKMLEVAKRLRGCDVVTTYLGPHAFPVEMARDEYFAQVVEKVLPEVAKRGLAERVDIFIEEGFFSREQGERYFRRAKELSFSIVAHVEQVTHQGGADLAMNFGALSVDHGVHLSDAGIVRLSSSETVAVLLPAADFYLKIPYPKARDLIDAGARVALATDFNPGSSPTQDLSFVGVLARLEMKMTLPEVIAAYTVNAAKALNRDQLVGCLTPGRRADFVVLDDDYESLFYQVGYHPVAQVYRRGVCEFSRG
jgi:imidazolonepropionase